MKAVKENNLQILKSPNWFLWRKQENNGKWRIVKKQKQKPENNKLVQNE